MRLMSVLLAILAFSGSVLAQGNTDIAYTSLDRTLQFRYPAAWSVQETWEDEGVGLGSSAEVLSSDDDAVFAEDVYIHISAEPLSHFVDARNLPEALAATQVEGDEEIVIRGQPALLKRWELDTLEALDLRIQSPTAILFLSAMSSAGKLDQFEADFFDIANSLRYIPVFENFPPNVHSTFDNNAVNNVLWPQGASERGKLRIEGGYYAITHLQTDKIINAILRNQRVYENIHISMTVLLDDDTAKEIRSFGIIFRMVDAANYYYFEIFSSGVYGLWKSVDGEWTSLLEGNSWPASDAVLPVNDQLTLEVTLNGNMIAVAANGEALTLVVDETFTEGQVGLSSTANPVENPTLLVDEFRVEALASQPAPVAE